MDQQHHEIEHLRGLGVERLLERYPSDSHQPTLQRLEHELVSLDQAGLAKWFLTAADFGRFAHDEGIYLRLVGVGCGSILSYLLGLSDVEPLRYQLPPSLLCSPGEQGMPELTFAVDPYHVKPVADFVHKRCGPDMVEEEIRLPRLHVENPSPYHTLDIACREPSVADGRFLFRAASQWELLPVLVAKMIESVTDPLFDLAGIPLDDMPTFELIRQGCDLEVYPPDWEEWDLRTVHIPRAAKLDDIVAFYGKRDSSVSAYMAASRAINTYQMLYLRVHYPLEFEAAIQQRWPSVPDEEGF
jgi:hypothetical protein